MKQRIAITEGKTREESQKWLDTVHKRRLALPSAATLPHSKDDTGAGGGTSAAGSSGGGAGGGAGAGAGAGGGAGTASGGGTGAAHGHRTRPSVDGRLGGSHAHVHLMEYGFENIPFADALERSEYSLKTLAEVGAYVKARAAAESRYAASLRDLGDASASLVSSLWSGARGALVTDNGTIQAAFRTCRRGERNVSDLRTRLHSVLEASAQRLAALKQQHSSATKVYVLLLLLDVSLAMFGAHAPCRPACTGSPEMARPLSQRCAQLGRRWPRPASA